MNMSKAKSVAAIVALLILLTACDSLAIFSQPEPEALETQSTLGTQQQSEEEQPATPEEPEPEEEKEPAPAIERGVVEDEVYTNASIGLRFVLPEGWGFADEETITMMMGAVIKLIAENGGELNAADIDAIYDMVAYNAATDSNAMVMIESLDISPGAEPPTAQAQLEALRERLEEMDVFGFEFGQPFTVWVAGQTFDTLPIEVNVNGAQTQQYYLVRIQDGHMVTIIASLFEDLSFEQLVGHFSSPE